jgi:D-serine deaminase-like pyridoxal phosphate-dependent protein
MGLWLQHLFSRYGFLHAAVILTRIISKPAHNLICLDLGHKAIASEMPHPRLKILSLENYSVVNHSEEHMVICTDEAENFRVGDILYGIPYHICPTVDRFDVAVMVT